MPETTLKINARDNASKKIKKVSNVAKAAMVAAAVAIGVATVAVKQSVEAFKKQEQAVAKLQAAVGGNTADLERFASQMQKITTVGDEVTLKTLQLASSMGVARDRLTEVGKNSIALSKSLDVSSQTAVKFAAAIESGNTTLLTRYIPALKDAKTQAEKNAIVQDTLAKGMRIAKKSAETFTGRLMQLKNIQGDLKEDFGRLVSVIGKDFVKSSIKATEKIRAFVTDGNKMGTVVGNIAGTFEVLKLIMKPIVDNVFKIFADASKNISENMERLNSESDTTIDQFMMLGGVTNGLGIAFKFVGGSVNLFITNLFNFIQISKDVIQIATTLFELLETRDFSKVGDAFKDLGGSLKDFGVDMAIGTAEIVTTAAEGFMTFSADAMKAAETMRETYTEAFNTAKKNTENALADMSEYQGKYITTIVDGVEVAEKSFEELRKEMKKTGDASGELGSSGEQAAKAFTAAWDKTGKHVLEIGQGIADGLNDIFSGITDLFNQQTEQINSTMETQLAAIDAAMEAELERNGLLEQSHVQRMASRVEELQRALTTAEGDENKKAAQSELTTAKSELKKSQIVEKAEKKKIEAQKKAAKKAYEIQKNLFIADKAMKIVNVWVNAAAGIAGAWSQAFLSAPPPVAAIMAAVATTALLTNAGIQTGVIASKAPPSPPSFAGGGVSPGGPIKVSEVGGETIITPRGSRIIDADTTQGRSGGAQFILNNPVFNGIQDLETFKNTMIEIQEQESVEFD